jgi:hypothetical protein
MAVSKHRQVSRAEWLKRHHFNDREAVGLSQVYWTRRNPVTGRKEMNPAIKIMAKQRSALWMTHQAKVNREGMGKVAARQAWDKRIFNSYAAQQTKLVNEAAQRYGRSPSLIQKMLAEAKLGSNWIVTTSKDKSHRIAPSISPFAYYRSVMKKLGVAVETEWDTPKHVQMLRQRQPAMKRSTVEAQRMVRYLTAQIVASNDPDERRRIRAHRDFWRNMMRYK